MYQWRQLSEVERDEILAYRKGRGLPWHRPPHRQYDGPVTFIITGACFEHTDVIGLDAKRMADFETELVESCEASGDKVHAWCVLPNHYHLLVWSDKIRLLRKSIGQLHGRTSFSWNKEDGITGRKVWFNYFDRDMRSERHFWASINYIHNNPVRHGYVEKWLDWPFSSAHRFLVETGRIEAERIWREYPILDYGNGWDD